MFDLDRFIADCCDAVAQDPSHRAAREVAARAVADPSAVLTGLGTPERAGVTSLYQSDTLTILNVVWGPLMNVPAHNHEMWAVIGVYAGREDNIFWRRIEDENGQSIEAAGAKSLGATDADFAHDRFVEVYNADLANGIGNAASRVANMIAKYFGGACPEPTGAVTDEARRVMDVAQQNSRRAREAMDETRPADALGAALGWNN